MRNYRTAFFVVVIGNLALAALLAGLWWRSRTARAAQPPQAAEKEAPIPRAQDNSSGEAPAKTEAPLAPVQMTAERLQSIGVKFGTVKREHVEDEMRATGNVAVDETRLTYVQTRFSGFIEKVFVDATYKYVRKGDPLFTIYSPELAAAQREYLVAKHNAQSLSQSAVPDVAAGVRSLLEASTDRLKQWNVPQREIARLETSGAVQQAIEVDSPVSGYITERNALPNLTVQPDTRLYTITDLSTVWVFAQIFQNDLGRVRPGQPAALTVDAYPGKTFRGRVDFVYPDVDMATRTARVRLVFANPNLRLKPGMFVNVNLQVPLGSQLVIPADGVLQSGARQIVFVDRGGGYLEPREVQLGARTRDRYVVLKGLTAGERIVTSANFLIDSESQLQAAIGSFVPPPPGAGAAASMNNAPPQSVVQLQFSTAPDPPRKGANVYRVKLSNADGSPAAGAQVSVRSYMPGMPEMGMAAMNTVTPLAENSPGVYEGKVDLQSGGTWQITITAAKDGSTLATRKLNLIATGGM